MNSPSVLLLALLQASGAGATSQSTPALPADRAAVAEPPDSGVVVVSCLVRRSGRLEDCTIVSETPEGEGFGEAALRAATESRITFSRSNPWRRGSRTEFRVQFDAAGSPTP
ncbi:TonB family protein [Brevundimonas sp.]|uniref:TonB family protein n=1 Tax=Brevundimonas sp. TaxID=1871086 RepID=UPI0039194592